MRPTRCRTPFRSASRPARAPMIPTRRLAGLVAIDGVLTLTGFLGKVSPAHLFWGSFDFAVTRFSGRTAPLHPGGFPALPDTVTQEAYSPVSSAGFWPGGGGLEEVAFYSSPTPTPRTASATLRCRRPRHISTPSSANSCCLMTRYGRRRSGSDPDGLPDDDLSGRSRPWRPRWNAHSASPAFQGRSTSVANLDGHREKEPRGLGRIANAAPRSSLARRL